MNDLKPGQSPIGSIQSRVVARTLLVTRNEAKTLVRVVQVEHDGPLPETKRVENVIIEHCTEEDQSKENNW
jgi:hypothetical protein